MSLQRYSLINGNFPREFILLQGTGCFWKRCSFCDYHTDKSEAPYKTNKPILQQITGETGVLDIINSGSCFELDSQTIQHIREIVEEKNIKTLWFESHYSYKDKLMEFRENFPSCQVKFRTGIETFDVNLRKSWVKGIATSVTPEMVAKYFQGICLLVGIKGQTKDGIIRDISIADSLFEYYSVNVFVENSTNVKQDKGLVCWFKNELYPKICHNKKAEILISNTDLGVG